MVAGDSIADIARRQRAINAQWITGTLAALTVAAVGITVSRGSVWKVWASLLTAALGLGVAHWLVRRGKVTAGILLAAVCLLTSQIGLVALRGSADPLPYVAPIVILLVAAAAPSRWLVLALALVAVALVAEGWLSPWTFDEQSTLIVATLLTLLIFVVSMLHVRGTERAFELARVQERERATAAERAERADELYRLVADHADDLIALVDADGKALYLSPSHERLLGVNVEQVLGTRVRDFLSIINLEESTEAFRSTLVRGEAHVELRLPQADSGILVLDSVMKRVEPEGRSPAVAIISRDVTERRRLENRLQSAQQLEALGKLAGGIAHDFNNLLTIIGGAAELARAEVEDGSSAKTDLDAVLEAASSASRLTRQLLTFSRKQLVVPSRIDLASAVRARRELLERIVGKTVRLQLDFAPEVPPVMLANTHLEQLLMNMAVNARDAMPGGGTLSLRLRHRRVTDAEVDGLEGGDYAELSFADEGSGIEASALPHLFEPFFSTKGEAGTGLGLATCMGIVTQLRGTIEVESRVGAGATFNIYLPVAPEQAIQPANTKRRIDVQRVLVVDDEDAVRETTARMLRVAGYQVHTAANLDEAMKLLTNTETSLEALVTDVVLGKERGTELLQRCREARPWARIVVMSGFSPDPQAAMLLFEYGARFLPKPFGSQQLLDALRDT